MKASLLCAITALLIVIPVHVSAQSTLESRVKTALDTLAEIKAFAKKVDSELPSEIFEVSYGDSIASCRFLTKYREISNQINDQQVNLHRQANALFQDVRILRIEAWHTKHKAVLTQVMTDLISIRSELYEYYPANKRSWRSGYIEHVRYLNESLHNSVSRKCGAGG